jgi:GTPase SAR1 family protein
MPANLSPEFKKAEAEFKQAREPRERLRCLREMLRTIPKHKGTEHLQADIKTRIKQLTEELTGPKKGGARSGPTHSIRPEGAAQVVLIGPPNAGKSSLHARLTGSRAKAAPYPYTTKTPLPGMLPYEGIDFQLVDLPPISAEFMEPWYVNALRPADAAMLVVDLSDPECVEQVVAIRDWLDGKKVTLDEQWAGATVGEVAAGAGRREDARQAGEDADEVPDPFRIHLPTLLVANKSDLDPDPDDVRVLEELLGVRFPAVAVSLRRDGRGAGRDRSAALRRARDRAGLHQGSGATRGQEAPLRRAPGRHRPGRRAPGAQGDRRVPEVRARVGQRAVRRTAGGSRPPDGGRGHHRAPRLSRACWSQGMNGGDAPSQ